MLLELFKSRRSIRVFKNQEIEKEKIDYLIKSALSAPSSRRLQPWEFIIVTDRELLDKLSSSKQGADLLKSAPLAIVVCADPRKCDVWIEDCSIASSYLLLAAHELSLGACWVQIRKRFHDPHKTANEYVKQILDIPAHYEVESIIGIGYAGEEKAGYDEESFDFTKVYYNQYTNEAK